jgi:hypothetical protein
VLYALDTDWWKQHLAEARDTFHGAMVSPQQIAGVRCERAWLDARPTNSGAALIAQAAYWHVPRVILLGYDCQRTAGRAHWHGDHPQGLRNATGIHDWPGHFQQILSRLRGMDVINASRKTALTVFPRSTLEEALA